MLNRIPYGTYTHFLTVKPYGTARRMVNAKNRTGNLGSSRSDKTGETDNLSGADIEAYIVKPGRE